MIASGTSRSTSAASAPPSDSRLARWARRALEGNGLSWFYTFEWPLFAGIGVAAWWHLIHEDPEARAARRAVRERVDPVERQAEW